MASYLYLGAQARVYQFFVANPGDVREFDAPPNDGQWAPVDPAAPAPEVPAPDPVSGAAAQEAADLERLGFTVTPPAQEG